MNSNPNRGSHRKDEVTFVAVLVTLGLALATAAVAGGTEKEATDMKELHGVIDDARQARIAALIEADTHKENRS